LALLVNKKVLLEDGDVKRWHEGLLQQSENTATAYLYHVKTFLQTMNVSLNEFINMNIEQRSLIINDWIRESQKTRAPKGVFSALCGIRSLLTAKKADFILDRTIKFKGLNLTPTVEEEKTPSPDDIRRALHHADVRTKTCIALISFSGLRYATQASLKLGDLVDLDIETLTMKNSPCLIWVPALANRKARKPYRTFLIKEGVEYLIEYLRERMMNGEKLTKESPLIASDYGWSKGRAIKSFTIKKCVRKALRRAGIKERPYILRGYFDFALASARVQHTFQQYFMGHAGDLEAVYAMKKYIPDTLLEPLRQAYMDAEDHLTTLPKVESKEQRKRMALDALKILEAFLPSHPAIQEIRKTLG